MLGYYGGYWFVWTNPHLVTFDPYNKLILINEGVTELDVKQHLYSDWKEWVATYDNMKYPSALRVVGGDYINETTQLGSTFFLSNGWRIKPWDGHNAIKIVGNLYTEEGERPIVPDNNGTDAVSTTLSTLVETIVIDNTVIYDGLKPVWDFQIGITNAYQSGAFINATWGSASDNNPVLYKVFISEVREDLFTDASLLGAFDGNAISISTEADSVSPLRDVQYYLGVRAVDVNNNETDNSNSLSVAFIPTALQSGALTDEQHAQLMALPLTGLDDANESRLIEITTKVGLTAEQHDKLMSLVNYDDKALRNLAYAILGQ